MSSLEEKKKKQALEEFQSHESKLSSPKSRRSFLKLMGASMSLAGLSGCGPFRKPKQTIVPYAKQPEQLVHGKANYYATAMPLKDSCSGLLVESHDGRPTKIEGNPNHPESLGATTTMQQASILNLYDPDRAKGIKQNEIAKTESELDSYLKEIKKIHGGDGKELVLLLEESNSPTIKRLLKRMKKTYPNADILRYNPANSDNESAGLKNITNTYLTTSHKISEANVIVSFDNDFLSRDGNSISNAKEFAKRRSPNHPKGLNRLYVFESIFSLTGGKADHRYEVQSSKIIQVLASIANKVIKKTKTDLNLSGLKNLSYGYQGKQIVSDTVIEEIVKELLKNKGKSLLLAGSNQSEVVHSLVYLLNYLLGNINNSIFYMKDANKEMSYEKKSNKDSLNHLYNKIKDKTVKTLILFGGNIAHNSFGNLNFKNLLQEVPQTLHLTEIENETSQKCKWVVAKSHFLESWGDAQTKSGVRSIIQPVISPLYNSYSEITLISKLIGSKQSDYAHVRQSCRSFIGTKSFDSKWKRYLHNGLINKANKSIKRTPLNFTSIRKQLKKQLSSVNISSFELIATTDYKMLDGRFINNPWLQELPDPITKLTWDNAAILSPKLAGSLGIVTGTVIELSFGLRKLLVPAILIDGTEENTIGLTMGYGQKLNGKIGNNIGENVFEILNSKFSNVLTNIKITKTNKTHALALSQTENSLNGRPIYRDANTKDFKNNPKIIKEEVHYPALKSLWKEKKYTEGYQWGMTIDLSKCTGCSACVVACQSENNIPTVGKDGVMDGREMHWLRIDRYFKHTENGVQMKTQAMACVHCEMAPCEQVCPVSATVHDDEGLNVMVYNRCIGTRYCSNNCPYKVRRFNFFDWHQKNPHAIKKDRKHFFDYIKEPAKQQQLQFNPDVTVRMRGVMEKCTYCTQRISGAKADAENENRSVRDGEIVTACQQTCASEAIVFGNINDKDSAVAKTREDDRAYAILAELNLKPRTLFLGEITNQNPKLIKQKTKGATHEHAH